MHQLDNANERETLIPQASQTVNPDHQPSVSKLTRGLTNQAISAIACFVGWSDTYFLSKAGMEYAEVAGVTGDVRLLCRNCLTSGSSVGFYLAQHMGLLKTNDAERNKIIDDMNEEVLTGYLQATFIWLFSSSLYGLSRFLVSAINSSVVIDDVTNTYNDIGLIGNFPTVFLTPMVLIALQCGSWKMPLASNLLFRLSVPLLSYQLPPLMSMLIDNPQENGRAELYAIYWANAMAPWLGYIPMALYMHFGGKFKNVRRWSFKDIPSALCTHFFKQLKKAIQMVTLRAAEYANLSGINFDLAAIKESNNIATNAFLQTSPFVTLAAIGAGAFAIMTMAEKRRSFNALCKEIMDHNTQLSVDERNEKLLRAKTLYGEMVSLIATTYLVGIVINIAFTLVFCCLGKFIQDLPIFTPTSASEKERDASIDVLFTNGFGLIPDALRIITASLLTTFDHPVEPNVVALILITLLGVPVGVNVFIDMLHKNIDTTFWLRNALLIWTCILNMETLYSCLLKDGAKWHAASKRVNNNAAVEVVSTVQEIAPVSEAKASSQSGCLSRFTLFAQNTIASALLEQSSATVFDVPVEEQSFCASAKSNAVHLAKVVTGYNFFKRVGNGLRDLPQLALERVLHNIF